MEWIPNQPVYFGGEDNCNADEVQFVQIIDNTDKTQVQFKVDACQFAQNINEYPQFEINNWIGDWSNNGACGNSSTGYSSFNYPFQAGYYKFVIDVKSIECVLNVQFDTHLIGTISTTGTYIFYSFCTPLDGTFKLFVTGEGNVCLNKFDAFEVLTNAIIAIYDADGNWVDDVRYDSNPEYFEFVDDSLTITIDWAEREISNGCYYLCFLDPCENTNGQNYMANIRDGEFAQDLTDNWTSAGGVNQYGNVIVFYNGSITQTNVFNSYTSSITIQINILSLDGTLNVYYGPYGIATPVATFTNETGIKTITGIPFGSFDLVIYAFGDCSIDYVGAVNVIPDNYVCDLTSPLMRLGDYTNDCTLLINACNNENGLGFNFSNSGFSPRLRLPAKLKNASYLNERSVYEDSGGKKSTYYFKRRKKKVLAIDLQPEYIHDFLSLAIGFDNFYINGQPYFVEDEEYAVDYPEVYDNVGKVKINVSEKVQNVKNVNCSDSENVCTLPPNSLLQTNLNFRIVQTNGSKILING